MKQVKFYKIKSFTDKNKEYVIRVFPNGKIICSCPYAVFKGNCKHERAIQEKLDKLNNIS